MKRRVRIEKGESKPQTLYAVVLGSVLRHRIENSRPINPKELILDKIRAEIMSKDGLEDALEIIDKYKEESEE